ncbi:hypothetical protein [Endothiovibrio diazotrophicus]
MKPRYLFILSEFNLPYLLLLIALRKEVHLYSERALFPPLKGVLGRVAKWLVRRGWAGLPESIPGSGEWLSGRPMVGHETLFRSNIYARAGERFSRWVGVDAGLDPLGYGYVGKKLVSRHLFAVMKDLFLVRWSREVMPEGAVRIVGVYADLAKLVEIYYGEPLYPVRCRPLIRGVTNLLLYVAACAYMALWLVRRLSLSGVRKERYQFAVDAMMGWLDPVYLRLPDAGERLLYFHRGRGIDERRRQAVPDHDHHCVADARVCARTLGASMSLLIGDGAAFLRRFWARDSDLFYSLVGALVVRGMYRAFFDRFSIDHFFMLDDYGADHVVRNLELRRSGGVALATNHGLPYTPFGSVPWLFVDADFYFSYGTRLYQRYYRRYWSESLRCIPVGSLAISPDQLGRAVAGERSNDIAFFLNPVDDLEGVLGGVIGLARRFPERKVVIWPKPSRVADGSFNTGNLRALDDAPPNLKLLVGMHDRDRFGSRPWVESVDTAGKRYVYEVMLQSGYAITVWSTTAAEAIQLRCITFFLDRDKASEQVYYRDFPTMCVDGFEEIAQRITRIEAGEERYDFQAFAELIDLEVRDPVPVIRRAVGLHTGEASDAR